jgi:hypothetical protein
MLRPLIPLALGAALLLSGCESAYEKDKDRAGDPEWLHEAVGDLTDVIIYDIMSPPQAARAYAYASIAAYEAIAPADPDRESLAGKVNGLARLPAPRAGEEYYLPLSSVYAFLTVGKALTFSQEKVEVARQEALTRFREMGIPSAVFARSVEYGDTIAARVLDWSRKDSFAQTRGYEKYTVTGAEGTWVPTAPAYLTAVEPNWGRVRPFTLDSASQYRPPPPPPYDMTKGSAFYDQVERVFLAGRGLTEEERAIAAFWDCNPYVMNLQGHLMVATKKISPGGHWMGITGIAARQAGADLARSAEAYSQVAIALADGFISAWEEKYRSNLVRPETVIQGHLDQGWKPLLQTPPFPEYPSGHSVISTAAAEVLTELFGDGFAFRDSTETRFGLPERSFASFREAAAEAAQSRLYGGIHYPMSIEVGVREGKSVGLQVLTRLRGGATPSMAANGAES